MSILYGSTPFIECPSFKKSQRASSISHSRSIFITFCDTSYNFSLENLVRNETKYIISLNFSFLSSVYSAMYCYFKDKLVIAHLYFGRVFVQVFSPIQ